MSSALLASSCSSNFVGPAAYPDVDPGPDVDIIGDAVSISQPDMTADYLSEGSSDEVR